VSVATRRAIYGKMSGDVTLNALLGTPASGYSKSIYYQHAPQGAGFPYVIFSLQANTPRYAMTATAGTAAFDDEVWLIKGVDRSLDADPVDSIVSRLNELLTDGTISISGKVQCLLRRESETPYAEVADGVRYLHGAALYRLVYTT
jgi:hypothetical protein